MVSYVRLSRCQHGDYQEAMKQQKGVYGRTCWSQWDRGIVCIIRDFVRMTSHVQNLHREVREADVFVRNMQKSPGWIPMFATSDGWICCLKINDDGLSYIDDFQSVQVIRKSMRSFRPFLCDMFWHLQMQVFRIIRWIRLFVLEKRPCVWWRRGLDWQRFWPIFWDWIYAIWSYLEFAWMLCFIISWTITFFSVW